MNAFGTASAPDILTFGCRLNATEGEAMRVLAPAGTLVVNTCAVTAEAERQARQAVRRAHRDAPARPIVITGCAAQIAPARWAALPGVTRVLGNAEKLRPAAWRETGHAVGDIMADATPAPPVTTFAGRARAFLQIQQGCDHRCTFCVIPFGRGRNRSVPAEVLVARARALVEGGFQEIVLTGVDIASYGASGHDPALGELCARLLREVPDLPRLRLSSLDPAAIDDSLWRLLAEEFRFMPHLHLSVQAGNDLVLKRMRRRHGRADVLALAARARALRPGTAIGADLIAGFPTETGAMFDDTLRLVEEAGFGFVHVFPYSERPGTPAARMPQVPVAVRRERAARLREAGAASTRAFLAAQVGSDVRVLTESDGGRAENYAPIRLGAALAHGRIVRARVTHAAADHLLAEAA